ncbi:hypothetical protein ACQKPX_24180 [Photobacterium sp. DNB23_23_1]
MRPEEEYVLSTLVDQFGGEYIDGEDPPDGYIINGEMRISVEVSMLVEKLTDENGKPYPRLKDDEPAKKLASKIELDIKDSIPDGKHVLLIISAPVTNIRKTQSSVSAAIKDMINIGNNKLEKLFFGNNISITILSEWPTGESKVGVAISNKYSSSNIVENVKKMLTERIETKNKKRVVRPTTTEYWLALYNDYWVANAETYQLAYQSDSIEHGFDKVLIVDGNRQVFVL